MSSIIRRQTIERRKKEPKSVHREKIASAASVLFMERGIAATSMDDIAKAAGYSKATLYVYFENKEEIVGILVLDSMKKLPTAQLEEFLISGVDKGDLRSIVLLQIVESDEVRISKKKTVLFAIMFLSLVGFVLGILYLKSVADYKQAVRETTFEDINISDIPDGVYVGEYDVDLIYAKVEVTVQNGEITNINILEHRHERGKTAEVITDSIVEEQKIDVDAISGATNSSTVIKKAVENALKSRKLTTF